MKGKRDGAGGTLKGDGRGRGFGNWSVANATLLLRSGETLDRRGQACQRFRHHWLERERPACAPQPNAMCFAIDGEWFMCLCHSLPFKLLSCRSLNVNSETVSNILLQGEAVEK